MSADVKVQHRAQKKRGICCCRPSSRFIAITFAIFARPFAVLGLGRSGYVMYK